MNTQSWSKIKHFSYREFDSPDEPGSGIRMRWETVSRLDQIREEVGFPLIINSGVRSPSHNAEVGGVDGSSHESGYASDVFSRTSGERFALVSAAIRLGFRRIGIGKTFVHLDMDPSKVQDVIWLYP